MDKPAQFVEWFRRSAPYINAHRGRTFVIAFGGEAVSDQRLASLVHDLALLSCLGIRLVLVHGARPQIERRMQGVGSQLRYVNGLRLTDETAMACVRDAVSEVRLSLEAALSMGLGNSPMAGLRIPVASGNVVTAKPVGVRDGVDYQWTGEVRRIDAASIKQRLDSDAVVLVSPLGYSPTGEVFNLSATDVAVATAHALHADKLLFLLEEDLVTDGGGSVQREIMPEALEQYIHQPEGQVADAGLRVLRGCNEAVRKGVRRVHLLNRHVDGALLRELFTRDGVGTLISAEQFERLRPAQADDVGGILDVIQPLESSGALVRRSRDLLENEIDHFVVIERDGVIIGCAALYPHGGAGELACLGVHPDYQGGGRAKRLLQAIEKQAGEKGLKQLFVLTTLTSHWFQEQGFSQVGVDDLPASKKALYNLQRNSRVFSKVL